MRSRRFLRNATSGVEVWDACALVPLFAIEARTSDFRSLVASDPVVQVWWGSRVEVTSAIAKKIRGGVLSPSDGVLAVSDVEAKFETLYIEVEPSRSLRARAARLVQVHNLGAADALQLAAFLESGLCREFVTLDQRLRDAALAEGATVLPVP